MKRKALPSSAGPKSSGDASPSFADPEFRDVHESPLTIGDIVTAVGKRGEIAPKIVMVSSTTDFLSLRASLGRTGAEATQEQSPANRLMPLETTTDADVLASSKHLAKAAMQRPKRNGDGNVIGGVCLPDMEAPLGVHAAQQEPKSFGCSLAGAYLAFTAERIAEPYYNSRDDNVQKIRTAARALQAERLLLPDDAAVIIDAAASIPWPPAEKK